MNIYLHTPNGIRIATVDECFANDIVVYNGVNYRAHYDPAVARIYHFHPDTMLRVHHVKHARRLSLNEARKAYGLRYSDAQLREMHPDLAEV